MTHPIFKDIFRVLGLPVLGDDERINEHGVKVKVCCEADMTLETRLTGSIHNGRWVELWDCKVCTKEIIHEAGEEQ